MVEPQARGIPRGGVGAPGRRGAVIRPGTGGGGAARVPLRPGAGGVEIPGIGARSGALARPGPGARRGMRGHLREAVDERSLVHLRPEGDPALGEGEGQAAGGRDREVQMGELGGAREHV